jgi:amino acid transporter/nucleotide-binding universal stress UspA family protein
MTQRSIFNNSKNHIPEAVTLSRTLGLFTITMIGVGGMIGAGIFVLTGIAAGVAGPALVLVFLLNGLVALFTAMAYAELGSAFPEAGGGYLWVKEGLGKTQGFLAGWMSWFAHVSAGSLYALGFGRFAAEIWQSAGLPMLGLSTAKMTLVWMILIVLVFTTVNYRGASETGIIGNIVTMTKITILGCFSLFGLAAMIRNGDWQSRFFNAFMPNGPVSVVIAMGVTFIAFEGYEIIAQSGEEVKDPRRNVPRAIFWAIGIAVMIYLLVGITAFGTVKTPPGLQPYEYLGQKKEIAVVEVARQIFPWGIGGIVLLLSGLISTMSALNATTYSSSRVSFAMGRDHNLPAFFARIHPLRHTPYLAVLASGGMMLVIASALPIEHVAAAADIMFLLLFLQVNVTVMALRHKMPQLDRGYVIPWFPAIPIIGLVSQGILAVTLLKFSLEAWITAGVWLVIGLLAYYAYFARIEAMEKPKEILLEEVLVSRDFSVLVPVATLEQARVMGQIGAIIAQANQGEVLALHVMKIPPQMTLSDGRLMLKEGRPMLEVVIQQAKQRDVPVHTIIRLGRNVAEAVRKTVEENATDLIVMAWPGYTETEGQFYGSVLDPIVKDPPADLAVIRYRQHRPLRSILVPVAGGLNSRRSVKLAVSMATVAEDGPIKLVLLNVVPPGAHNSYRARAEQVFRESLEGITYGFIETKVISGSDVVEAILNAATDHEGLPGCDLIVIGASREPLLKNFFMGSIPSQIAQRAQVTVIMVKRRNNPVRSFLRKTIIQTKNVGASSTLPQALSLPSKLVVLK